MNEFVSMPLSNNNFNLSTEIIDQNDKKALLSADQAKTRTHRSRNLRSKLRSRLPENYHQKVVELENEFLKCQSWEIVEELVNLYKVGVEYYSGKSIELQQDYMDRMHIFLSSKSVLKLIKMKSNITPANIETQTKTISKANKDKIIKRRQSQIMVHELNKLNFMNSKIHDTKNMNDFLRKFEIIIVKACIKLEHGIKMQRNEFIEKLKKRNFIKFLKSDSKVNERNQSFMKRRSTEIYNNSASLPQKNKPVLNLSLKKRLSFNEEVDCREYENLEAPSHFKETDSIDNSKIVSKKLYKSKKKHLGNIIDNYLTNLHNKYFERFCEPQIYKSINYLKENYEKKKNNFVDYYESRTEIEFMLLDNPNYTSKKLYKQLIDSMRIDYDKFLIDISQTENNHINKIIRKKAKKNLSEESVFVQLSDELVVNLVNLFK